MQRGALYSVSLDPGSADYNNVQRHKLFRRKTALVNSAGVFCFIALIKSSQRFSIRGRIPGGKFCGGFSFSNHNTRGEGSGEW